MTVENVTPLIRYPYTGPGAYSFSFLIYDEDDLTITYTDVYGSRTVLTITTDYTVTINSGSPGGSVTMIYSETTGAIEIARVLDYTQTTAWENEGALDMQLLEQDFDRTVMLLQQLKSEFYRAPAQATLRGNWTTATAYVQGDVVWDSTGEIFYACYADHTSGTLATDVALGYWFESLDLTSIYADAINAAVALAVALKADLASPALTGVPTAPTATAGTNTTQLATTANVVATAQRRLTTVSGLNTEGEIIGFDVTVSGNTLTIGKGSCVDRVHNAPIYFTADKTIVLDSTNNGEFFVFAVRLISDGSFEPRSYTTLAGVESDAAEIDAWQLVTYAKNNGSGVTMPYRQIGDRIDWTTSSRPVITASLTGAWVPYSISTVVPTAVCKDITFGPGVVVIGYQLYSYDGVSEAARSNQYNRVVNLLALASIYMMNVTTDTSVHVFGITLRR